MKKIIIIILAFFVIVILYNKSYKDEIIIPNDSIRIRIIANSNSKNDQNIKKNVKSIVNEKIYSLLKNTKTKEEVKTILNDNLNNIEYSIVSELNKSHINTDINLNYGYNYFPQKIYKGINYNKGYYESLVITLGEAKGDNWWCVLFPPLCLMDKDEENIDEFEYKSFVVDVLNKYF